MGKPQGAFTVHPYKTPYNCKWCFQRSGALNTYFVDGDGCSLVAFWSGQQRLVALESNGDFFPEEHSCWSTTTPLPGDLEVLRDCCSGTEWLLSQRHEGGKKQMFE